MIYAPVPFQSRAVQPALNLLAIPWLAGELARAAVWSTIDPAIVVMGLIAVISLLTQGVANMAWPNGTPLPIGNSGLLIAQSTSGKTALLSLFTEPIGRFLQDYVRSKRSEDREPAFFIEDATREAIILQLAEWGVGALITDEFSQMQALLRNGAPTLVKLNDGTSLYNARASRGRIALRNHRFVMLGMIQPNKFEEIKTSLGVGKGSVGLINRFLVGQATSLPDASVVMNYRLPSALQMRYEQRVAALLSKTIELVQSGKERPTLIVARDAHQRVIEIAEEMTALRGKHRAHSADEYISRHAERVLRLAGAFHVFQHDSKGEVGLESVEAAHHVGSWSIGSYLPLTEVAHKPTQREIDALQLEQRLLQIAYREGPSLKLKVLRRTCRNIGLTPARFDSALTVLAGERKVTICPVGRDDVLYVHAAGYTLPYVIG